VKIFDCKISRNQETEVLVIAKNEKEAKLRAEKAFCHSIIKFDEDCSSGISDISVLETSLTDHTIHRIKYFGILNENLELDSGQEIIDRLKKLEAKREKEEWLKKYHLEFDFVKK
jgi:hypothetical protein